MTILSQFVSDADRCQFLLLLQEGIARFGHRIHAFCLMTNHVHLAIQVDTIPLSKIMQNLSFRYTRWFNRREQRIGHLFQGRYRAVLVERDSYLLELVRYIHLNPLRAGMVQDVVDYAWSGHRAYAGLDLLPWLTEDYMLIQLAHEGKEENRSRRWNITTIPKPGPVSVLVDHAETQYSGILIYDALFAVIYCRII